MKTYNILFQKYFIDLTFENTFIFKKIIIVVIYAL